MSYKILTVDDSRTIRMIVKRAFQQYNCELFEAENGVEGLAMAAKEKPDLIVLDITMPVMTGIEMLRKLKADYELKKIPVIMLTAESGKDNVMNIVKMGVSDYIVKPFKGDQIIERARNIINLKLDTDTGGETNSADPQDCFKVDGDFLIMALPVKISRSMATQLDSAAKGKIEQMNASWAHKMIVDLSVVADINKNAIQLIISIFSNCAKANIPSRMVASDSQAEILSGFQETGVIQIEPTLQQAKTSL